MLEVEWTTAEGWGVPRICPIHNLSLHPGAKVFHYAQELFEGMKAFRGEDNKIRLFRPDLNMKRMRTLAGRCCFPVSTNALNYLSTCTIGSHAHERERKGKNLLNSLNFCKLQQKFLSFS
ncbi:uncharacterized protein LOC143243076 [Tachypleus tridentatus]|uniref:uncharacterized protein LOC143243076 n=1 Tax=Tachypleus tridentatus TaxID=6853 RepID=UPI003FD11F09